MLSTQVIFVYLTLRAGSIARKVCMLLKETNISNKELIAIFCESFNIDRISRSECIIGMLPSIVFLTAKKKNKLINCKMKKKIYEIEKKS